MMREATPRMAFTLPQREPDSFLSGVRFAIGKPPVKGGGERAISLTSSASPASGPPRRLSTERARERTPRDPSNDSSSNASPPSLAGPNQPASYGGSAEASATADCGFASK